MLRPKADGHEARFYSVVARDTIDQDFAAHRQRFLAEQGYAYRIMDADELLAGELRRARAAGREYGGCLSGPRRTPASSAYSPRTTTPKAARHEDLDGAQGVADAVAVDGDR